METATVAMDSERPSDRSQTKFMTIFYRKTFTELKSIEYRKSALFRHFLAVFSLYRELYDLHKVDCAWIRTL